MRLETGGKIVYKKRGMTTTYIVAIVLVALIAVGTLAYYLREMAGKSANEQFEEDKDLQDTVMEYMKMNHPDASVYIKEDMSWNGSGSTPIKVGFERYVYTSEEWTVTFDYATTAKRIYEVTAKYNEKIMWTGEIDDDGITETGYNCDANETGLEIRTAIMEYIKKNHPDAADFIGEPDKMVWDKESSEIKIGYSKHVYTSNGWNMTIGHAATAELMYEVRAENKNEGITWTGTVQDETVNETSYTH